MEREAQRTLAKVKKALPALGDRLKEAEAIGVFGSLARGRDFTERSDLDIFIIVQQKKPEDDLHWYRLISEALAPLERDITVLVYSLKGLREISNWYVLRLAAEGVLLFDQGGVRELFRMIIQAAQEAGMAEEELEDGQKVWTIRNLRLGDVVEVRVK